MRQRRVVLGVTGSIAAYKAAELVRLLKKAGIDVHVILTRSGAEFITPLTLGTLTGNPVTTDMFAEATGGPYMQWGAPDAGGSVPEDAPVGSTDGGSTGGGTTGAGSTGAGLAGGGTEGAVSSGGAGIRHIQVSRESDLIVVAPASGNILGKVAHGIADDPLSTAIMASSAPVLFAPAMNTRMWENPAVRANVALLVERGYLFVQPGSGELACGDMGTGRMAEPAEIADAVLRHMTARGGNGRRLLVTAGRTEEPIDPVRYLSNRSSGKMGFAVAEAGRDLGYAVTLIAGPSSVPPPLGVELIRVETAEQMAHEVRQRHEAHEVLVMAAAVADYRPAQVESQKVAGGRKDLHLELLPNADILAGLRGKRDGRVTVGFALETGEALIRAARKLEAKGLDLIVVNNPLRKGSEFGGDTNEVTFLYPGGRAEPMPPMKKTEVARAILRRVEALR